MTLSPDGKNVYIASLTDSAIAIFDRDSATGAIAQRAGTGGCVSDTGSGGLCADGNALNFAIGVTISPDGRSAYATTFGSSSVVIFDRDTTTGALTQKGGTAGCVSLGGSGGLCVAGVALGESVSAAVSPDGANVYVASAIPASVSTTGSAVAVFDRNAASGALTQKPGTAGCISATGAGGACAIGRALDTAFSVAVSQDGKNVYSASVAGGVAVFDRDAATGALTQKAGIAGCISETGTAGACADGHALTDPASLAVSPLGNNVYVASMNGDEVAVFDRDAATGALTQKAGAAGCVSETGDAGMCTDGTALDGARSVTVSPLGDSVYVASTTSDAIAVFDRDATTGALTQPAGTGGCTSDSGTGGGCALGVGVTGAFGVAVSPDGLSTYVTGGTSGASSAVAVFDRGLARGTPTPPPAPPPPPPDVVASTPSPPPTPASSAPVPDTTPPAFGLSGSRKQKLGSSIAVGVICSSEACTATVGASVRVPGIGRSKAKTVRLKTVRKTIAQGRKVTIRLALPASARSAIKRALRAHKRVAVAVIATVADAAGNKRTVARAVRLTA